MELRVLLLLMLFAGGAAPAAECAHCPAMLTLPAGRLLMGAPPQELGRFDSEGPVHEVTLKRFALSETPVTVDQFLAFLRASGYQPAPCNKIIGLQWRSPGHGRALPPTDTEAPDWPATCLSWTDAQAYIGWLNSQHTSQDGGPYRLPSEAEWEYAARAGSTSSRWWGETIGSGKANCAGCGSRWDGRSIAPVGQFPANPFGLKDMLGNIWQWVEDCWHDSYVGAPTDGRAWLGGDCQRRVMRGGSWSSLPVFVRSAARWRADKDGRDFDYSSYAGFRIARSLP